MNTEIVSSINLCPINFTAFTEAQEKIANIDAILLLSKLKFHQINSTIQKSGHTWIARSREQLSEWFGFSTKKIDRILSELYEKKHIEKRVSLWYGKKKLFISATNTLKTIPINHKLFEILKELTGTISATLVYSKIAFAFANSKIKHDETKWCCITEKELSKIAGISLRTLDKITESLQKKGLLIKRKYVWQEKYKTHYHIPEHVIKTILTNAKQESKKAVSIQISPSEKNCSDLQNTVIPVLESKTTSLYKKNTENGQLCHSIPANLSISIKLRTKEKKLNNNTVVAPKFDVTLMPSDINFYSIGTELTYRQEKYLEAALINTIKRENLNISNQYELRQEILFSLLNIHQRKNINTFPHAISRCMKILSSGNWKTPIGFYKYSPIGQLLKSKKEDYLIKWDIQKKMECQTVSPSLSLNKISTLFTQTLKPINEQLSVITEKAVKIAKKIAMLDREKETGYMPEKQSLFFDMLMSALESYLKQGADCQEIKKYLT